MLRPVVIMDWRGHGGLRSAGLEELSWVLLPNSAPRASPTHLGYAEVVQGNGAHPVQVPQWKRELQDRIGEIFERKNGR